MNRLIVLNFVVALALVACGDSSAPGTTTGEECSDNADCIDGICIDGECLVGEADTGDDPLDDPTLDSNPGHSSAPAKPTPTATLAIVSTPRAVAFARPCVLMPARTNGSVD
jgi:hypothetical protein